MIGYKPGLGLLKMTRVPSMLVPTGVFTSFMVGPHEDKRIDTIKQDVEEQINKVVLLLPPSQIK